MVLKSIFAFVVLLQLSCTTTRDVPRDGLKPIEECTDPGLDGCAPSGPSGPPPSFFKT